MTKRFCDVCGKEIIKDVGWVLLEYRIELDANTPSIATAEACTDCVKQIPLKAWK